MANTIQIKRSTTTNKPTGLLAGEMAWSDGLKSLFIRDAGNNNNIIIGGPSWVRRPCHCATTADITTILTGAPNTVDGFSLSIGDRVLVKNQVPASENGIYQVDTVGTGANGVWSRVLDFDEQANVESGMSVAVRHGTVAGGTFWTITTNDEAIVVGTDAIDFTEIAGSTSVTGGNGIDVTGSVVSVDLAVSNPGLTNTAETNKLAILVDANGGLALGASGIGFDGTVDGAGLTNTNGVLSVNSLNTLPAPAGDLAMATNKITGLGDPTLDQDGATKIYVDNAVAGARDIKDSCRVASTGDLTLSGEQTIDGILTSTDRVLVKNQTLGENNGIYVTSAGAWTRATDADTSAEVTAGMYTWIEEGTTNGDQGFLLTTDGAITLGTTPLTFTQVSGLGQVTAGTGLSKTGNTLNMLTVTETLGGTNQTTYATGDLLHATGANTLGKLALGTATGSIGQFLKVNAGATNIEYSDVVDGGTF